MIAALVENAVFSFFGQLVGDIDAAVAEDAPGSYAQLDIGPHVGVFEGAAPPNS